MSCVPGVSPGYFQARQWRTYVDLSIGFYRSGRQDLNLRLLRPERINSIPTAVGGAQLD
jgi:hypothetical protein